MRNNVSFDSLQAVLPKLRKFIETNRMEEEVIEEAEIQIKYKGYIEREKFIAEKLHRLENIRIPGDFDFHSMNSLTIEARQNYPEFGLKHRASLSHTRSFSRRRKCSLGKIRKIG